MSVLAIAGSALLLAVDTSLQTSDETLETMIADGMARQLMDEAAGKLYMTQGGDPYQYPLMANVAEASGLGRELYDDTNDYNGFVAQPAEDVYGFELGQGNDAGGLRHPNFRLPAGYFADWRQSVEVYYVSEADPTVRLASGSTSNIKAIDVRIYRQESAGGLVELARRRQVISYFPPMN